jgi:hypothetical protein
LRSLARASSVVANEVMREVNEVLPVPASFSHTNGTRRILVHTAVPIVGEAQTLPRRVAELRGYGLDFVWSSPEDEGQTS